MPMRAFRASTAHAGAHVMGNLRLWTAVFAALTLGACLLLRGNALGLAGRWGDLVALSGMVLGVLIILVGVEGEEAAPEPAVE